MTTQGKRKQSEAASAVQADSGERRKLEFPPLDKNSFTPLYYQIQTQLLAMIKSGQLRYDDPLPSEEELSRIYSISRMTSRQALQALKGLGYASRQRGRGSFVSKPRVEKDITHLCGFTAEMRALGIQATSKVLESGIEPASAEIAAQLGIAVEAPILRMKRLRMADGIPVAVEVIQLPEKRFPGIAKYDFARISLYQTLRETYDIRFSRAEEILEARAATRHEAELLQVQPRFSLLVISRTLWSVDGKPVETAHSVYRGDRYRAVLSIPATAME